METLLASGVTKTAAGAETGVSVAALVATVAVLWVEFAVVSSASGTPGARVVIEQSATGDFDDTVPVVEFGVGAVVVSAPVRVSHRVAAGPLTLIGATGAKMRANLVQLLGGTPSVTYSAGITT